MNASRFVNKNIIDALDNFQNYELHQKKLKQMKKELEMKKQGKLKVIDEDDENLKMRVIANKLKNHEFNDSEKILEIQKSNQKLMQKLYDISQGKQSTLRNILGPDYSNIQVAIQAQQQQMQQMQQLAITDGGNNSEQIKAIMPSDSQFLHETKQGSQFLSQMSANNNSQLKSLHMPFRKREATRIDEENQRMIDRIMHANPSLPNKKLEKDYQNHLQLKKIIQKANPIPVEKLIQRKNKLYENLESQLLPPIEVQSSEKKERENKIRSNSERKTSRNHDQDKYHTEVNPIKERGLENIQGYDGTQGHKSVLKPNVKEQQPQPLKNVKSHSVLPQPKQNKIISTKAGNSLSEHKGSVQLNQPPKTLLNKDIAQSVSKEQGQEKAKFQATDQTVKDQKYATQKITETKPIKLNATTNQQSLASTLGNIQSKPKDKERDEEQYSEYENDIQEDMENSIIEDSIIDDEVGGRNTNLSLKGKQAQSKNGTKGPQGFAVGKDNFQNKEFKFDNFKSPTQNSQKTVDLPNQSNKKSGVLDQKKQQNEDDSDIVDEFNTSFKSPSKNATIKSNNPILGSQLSMSKTNQQQQQQTNSLKQPAASTQQVKTNVTEKPNIALKQSFQSNNQNQKSLQSSNDSTKANQQLKQQQPETVKYNPPAQNTQIKVQANTTQKSKLKEESVIEDEAVYEEDDFEENYDDDFDN
ncbi:UNKNOWN [Stylonychia lemnae]|uniref:Uncharacterized protein n=1 Tax=Stylonychia lemnae TaxID=5949 RepID=A0A078AQ69_STYLE|nr:UNKNOWN [Stylonychia lemnae]|eukprot:CDW83093.1 UNKNOWN [Stylonychia lemnae]